MLSFFKKRKIKRNFIKCVNHLRNWRHNDDDILSEAQKREFDAVLAEADGAKSPESMRDFCDCADERMARIVAPLRFRGLREWLDIIAVAMAVAFGVRGLFFQPFKIPTSSMQPTLYGIHYMSREEASNPLLGKLPRPLDWLLFTTRPAKMTVREAGTVDPDSLRKSGGLFSDSLSFRIGNEEYSLPGTPEKVLDYTGLEPNRVYQKGEVVSDGFLSMGDHLFVDRVSHHLTGLHRGDVVVFNTENIASPDGRKLMDTSGYYYIKRLVGLPGDTLKIVDHQLFVCPRGTEKFVPIQELDKRFEKVYSGKGGYQGHANYPGDTPFYSYYLRLPEDEFTVPADSYFMMGDNTRYSADSRSWGIVPRRNITGRALWVFWPFSRRWGLADHAGALDVPTGKPVRNTFPSMSYQ